MSKRKSPNRLLVAPVEALQDILAGLENQQTEGWSDFYKQPEDKDLPELNLMSLAIATCVAELSSHKPDEAIEYFRDQQKMRFPSFLRNSEL